VTMAVKCQLRNNNPVLIALATNDGLGASLQNIAACNIRKHLYFVPMAQDDPVGKPNSLICDFSKTAAFLAKIIATNDDLQ
ncbi:MAG: dipicolinate synthase subunit B, partial [Clostridia bacterium]